MNGEHPPDSNILVDDLLAEKSEITLSQIARCLSNNGLDAFKADRAREQLQFTGIGRWEDKVLYRTNRLYWDYVHGFSLDEAESETSENVAGKRKQIPPEISALVAAGENATVEFKSSARWDLRENKKSPIMEQVILKTVAAFLNSEGGTLLLGVSDDGATIGLEYDYQTLHKKNADGYELFLSDLLLNHYGRDCSPYVSISFHQLEGKQICRIIAQPTPRPVWVKEGGEEHLYIRSGNSTRRLTTREAIEYCKTRWKV